MRRQQPGIVWPVTAETRENYMRAVEEENPGYIEENGKLRAIVKTLTGLRVLYAVFYTYISWVYELDVSQGLLILLSSIFFFLWYSYMIRSGKVVAGMLLLFRGVGIASGGASLLSMVPWLPYTLLFALLFSLIMEFVEAVFCIYVMFNSTAALTVRLNYDMEKNITSPRVPAKQLEAAAEYQNPYREDGQESEQEPQEESQETPNGAQKPQQ